MQTYLLKLLAAQPSTVYQAQADLFVYESGTEAAAGDTRIIVKPDSGGEITLRPGQRFRLAPGDRATSWAVRMNDPAATLTGSIIIGSGEFDDANTLNKFTLDATFANNVKVTNTTAERVPVTLDTTQAITIGNTTAARVPVTLDTTQTLNIAGTVMAYTTSYSASGASTAGTAVQLLAPGTNVNGVVLNKFDLIGVNASNITFTVLAKNGAPTSLTDGDVLFAGIIPTTLGKISMDVGKDGSPKVPAGKGIYFFANQTDNATLRDALFTVL